MLAAVFVAHALFTGHGGFPPVATVLNPVSTASLSATSTAGFTVRWLDTNQPIATGTATLDLYYTEHNPPTYRLGTVPETLTGTAIARGIREIDPADSVRWDLSAVPTGTYWIWSIMNEPPNELGFQQIFYFSPGTLTVVQPGDEEPPSIYITAPDTPFPYADTSFELRYDARDPHGTGRVKLEATNALDGSKLRLIAEDLPAIRGGRYTWNTTAIEKGEWMIRATIEDARGRTRSVYARYFLLIEHFGDTDAGVREDAGGGEACGCEETRSRGPISSLALLLAICAARFRRRAASAARSSPA